MSDPIFSPSRGGTQDYQRCPRLYDYKKRWEPWEDWSPERAMGNILHAGLAAHHKGKDARVELDEATESEWLGEGSDEAFTLARKVMAEALSIDLLGDTGKVLAVEQEMGPEQCRPDLVLEHGGRSVAGTPDSEIPETVTAVTAGSPWLQVIDWKFSWTLKPEWVAKRLASYESSWQLKHYAWRVQQEYGIPCTQVTIVQMAAEPKVMARRIDFPVTRESLATWEASAREWWRRMAEGPYPQNYEGCRKYGENYLCPMYSGCHRLHGDETKFPSLYKRRVE